MNSRAQDLASVLFGSILVFLSLLTPSAAHPVTKYLCIATQAVGFSFDRQTGQWRPARFSVRGEKYLLEKRSQGWSWNQFGSSSPGGKCGDVNAGGYISCQDAAKEISFDQKTLRFQEIYPLGYVGGLWRALGNANVEVEGSDTPSIEIGVCTAL